MPTSITTARVIKDLEQLHVAVNKLTDGYKVFVIADSNVVAHCLPLVMSGLSASDEIDVIETEPGEESKSMEVAGHILAHLLECNAGRDTMIINLGGGVITDLGGFVASIYKRGIPFINLPTSLLAMVDASIGGKTGIDHGGIKNSVGTVALPAATIIFPDFLETLPAKEIRSGFAEMLKHALISDGDQWTKLLNIKALNAKKLYPFLEPSVRIKEAIVANDLQETAERKLLNFGHTIGHAIEAALIESGSLITHGEAIALGMIVETQIALGLKKINTDAHDEIIAGISKFFSPGKFKVPVFNTLVPFLMNDKKNKAGEMHMSLVTTAGVAIYDVAVKMAAAKSAYEQVFGKSPNA